jgi:glycosidase
MSDELKYKMPFVAQRQHLHNRMLQLTACITPGKGAGRLLPTACCLLLLLFATLACGCKDDAPADPGILPPAPAEWDGEKRGNVYYEIFVRSFADTDGDGIGDLRGVTDKLDYLHELGVAGIWLMPINPSPSYHGYDVENYKAVNPQYGSMSDFDALVAKASRLGIKVVLDLVINHTSKTHPWFTQACSNASSPCRDFFLFAPAGSVPSEIAAGRVPSVTSYNAYEWHDVEGNGVAELRYYGIFSSWMPDINPENTAVMDSIYAAAKFWLDKGVAGFRLDAAKHIYQVERSQQNIDFWRAFHNKLKTYKPDVYLVGEVLDSSPDNVAYFYRGLPALFNFPNWYNLEWALNNRTGCYYPKDVDDCLKKFAAQNPAYLNVPKLSNHDEDRTMSKLGGDVNKAKVAAAVLLTMPGQPYIYYGEEIGMRGMKTGGDENVREPFLWAPGNDPCRTRWRTPQYNTETSVSPLARQQADKNSLYAVYAEFIRLRNTYPALAEGNLTYPDPASIPEELMIYSRQAGAQRLMLLHNLGEATRSYPLPEPVKHAVASLNNAQLLQNSNAHIAQLPPLSSLVLEY